MNKSTKQYINIIKNQQNIKINYQVVEKNNILKTEQSVFVLDNTSFSQDTISKLEILEESIPRTYVSGICESPNQLIVPKDTKISQSQQLITYDTSHSILLNNDEIDRTKLFHNNGKIDYIFSPFSILQNIMLNDLVENSLNILILNDTIYSIILDKNKRYIYSKITSLTPYDEIKDSKFYNDEIVEQKLFDEIYSLELTENISNITKEFYEQETHSNFIENVNIFYIIKQLDDTQINSLKETLMMEVNYNQVSIDEFLYDLAKRKTASQFSFIKPRKKKLKLSTIIWFIIILISIFTTIALFYLAPKVEDEQIIQKQEKTVQNIPIKNETIPLIDHNHSNLQTVQFIKNIFDLIDEQSTLKEIQLQRSESTIVYNFKDELSYEKLLKPKLLRFYKQSENILTSKSKNQYNAIISNTGKIDKQIIKKTKYTAKSIDKTSSINLLKSFFNNTTIIKQLNERKTKYLRSTYQINTLIREPNEFYNIIETINKQPYSIQLSYPIEFIKSEKGIELRFNLIINQNIETNNK